MSEEQHLIEKKIFHAGTKNVDFNLGTRVTFHYQTRKCNAEKTIIDDSRKIGPGKPMVLVLGKKFKLEVWEVLVQKMSLNEVALFTVDKSLVNQYPFVSKTIRDMHLKKSERTHTCAQTIQHEGLGYEDLNELFKHPCNLEFIFELLKVEQPGDYEKDTWQLSEKEKVQMIPELREKGNTCFKNKDYMMASQHYAQALVFLEELQLMEKPHDTEWNDLAKQQVPFLLNFAQCKLYENDYYSAIEQCTKVIKTEPNNVKAYFRRAKAQVGAWDPKAAKEDFLEALKLDPSLNTIISKELANLEQLVKEKDQQDKENMKKLFSLMNVSD